MLARISSYSDFDYEKESALRIYVCNHVAKLCFSLIDIELILHWKKIIDLKLANVP